MKLHLTAVAVILVCASAFAAEPNTASNAKPLGDDKLGKLVRRALPACSGETKISAEEYKDKMPAGFSGSLITIQSEHPACGRQYISVTTNNGGHFLGTVWWLNDAKGENTKERLRSFLWMAMNQVFEPVIEKTRTPFGTIPVTLYQTTEYGKLPLTGEIDPEGKVFFFGHFRPATSDVAAARAKVFEPHVALAPSRGAEKPEVTLVEFSDFQCPACKRSANYADPILEKHGAKVRYVRFDLPLISAHPWAFGAALAGRAIHRQKPEAFWAFKKAVYENQDKLTPFTMDNFARGFVADNDLNLKKYEEDVSSQALRDEILAGLGAAYSNHVNSTPAYLVNGVLVDPGDDGKALTAYVEKLIK